MLYLKLFWEFFKTGLFTVGGGMASLPFLYDIADKTGWYTHAQLADMVAISESTPGPIGINMATYVGFLTAGPIGSILATLGFCLPSAAIAITVAAFLKAFRSNRYVLGAFYGLRPASAALITAALITVTKVTFFSTEAFDDLAHVFGNIEWKALALAAVLLVLTRWMPKVKNWHPIVFIALSAVAGIVFRFANC